MTASDHPGRLGRTPRGLASTEKPPSRSGSRRWASTRTRIPYHVHVGRVDLDGNGVTWLTEGRRHARGRVLPGRRGFSTTGRASITRRSTSCVAPPTGNGSANSGGRMPRRCRKRAGARRSASSPRAATARPTSGASSFARRTSIPKKRYPVIESIYAGPHGTSCQRAFSLVRRRREVAELGFVVVQIDGMGTNWRSKSFHDHCWQNLKDAGVPDRIAWITAAADERPDMDLERVGIYGGSAGGQSAMRALLAPPRHLSRRRRGLRLPRQPDGQDLVEPFVGQAMLTMVVAVVGREDH